MGRSEDYPFMPASFNGRFSNSIPFEMGTVQLLLFFNLIFPSLAVICYSEGKYLCCDYCYVSRWNYSDENLFFLSAGCIHGTGFASFKNKCWDGTERSFCLCDEYHCNYPYVQEWPTIYKEKFLIDWKKNLLTCGDETNCNACEYSNYTDYAHRGCLDDITDFTRVERLVFHSSQKRTFMQPQSCARFESDVYDGMTVKCLCDTGDNCDEKLMEEQQLISEAVTCHMGNQGNQTCTGDFCYIFYSEILSKYGRKPVRGCITNNETLSAGLYQPGYFTLRYDYQLVICDKNNCNKNLKRAKKSVTITEPSCPAPATVATTERNWAAWSVTKPNSIWSRLANEFFASLTGFIDD